jgi:histidinol phosphatase-like PHP family hydrolase
MKNENKTASSEANEKCAKCSERNDCEKKPDEHGFCWSFSRAIFKKEKIFGICKTCGNIQKRNMDGTISVQIMNYKTISEEERQKAIDNLHHCDECDAFFKSHTKPQTPTENKRAKRISELRDAYITIENNANYLNSIGKHNWKEIKSRVEAIESAIVIVKRLSKYKND